MVTITSLYICISSIYTYFYYFNSLSSYIPIACQSFSVHILCLWHILYLYFFCIPISILYTFLYLSCVHLFPGCHMSFSMFLFFFRLHIMSLVYIFFIFRFYDLLHSIYYYIYHLLSYTYIMSSFMLWLYAPAILFIYLSLFSTFCTLLVHILFVYYTLYFLYTIFIYLYSCTIHFLYCFPVILFI